MITLLIAILAFITGWYAHHLYRTHHDIQSLRTSGLFDNEDEGFWDWTREYTGSDTARESEGVTGG